MTLGNGVALAGASQLIGGYKRSQNAANNPVLVKHSPTMLTFVLLDTNRAAGREKAVVKFGWFHYLPILLTFSVLPLRFYPHVLSVWNRTHRFPPILIFCRCANSVWGISLEVFCARFVLERTGGYDVVGV